MSRNSDPLARLKRAARSKSRADEEFRSALVGAHCAGHSYAELARELGISRQAVRQMLKRHALTLYG